MERISIKLSLAIAMKIYDVVVLKCMDNTLRIVPSKSDLKSIDWNLFPKFNKVYYFVLNDIDVISNIKNGDYVVFADTSDIILRENILPLDNFQYKQIAGTDNCENFDGIYVPRELIKTTNMFFADHGVGKQFVYYLRNEKYYCVGIMRNLRDDNLIRRYFFEKTRPISNDIYKVLKDIDDYLSEFDIREFASNFKIQNVEHFISRPGKDDYYFIRKESTNIDDAYLKKLFPIIDEQIYTNSAFTEAYSMSINPIQNAYVEEEQLYREHAICNYDKNEHRKTLICNYIKDLIRQNGCIRNLCWQDKLLFERLESVRGIYKFVIDYNNLMRNKR